MASLTHKALFEKLRDTTVLTRCTDYARWTLPQLMVDFAYNSRGRVLVERDYQEIGALLTNHLASKLARLLFPANHPFFRIQPSRDLTQEVQSLGVKPEDMQSELARLELESGQQLFTNASYAQLILALKHLIVTGNVLIHRDSEGKRTVAHGLQNYVTRRDGRGNVIDAVLREFSYAEALPHDVLQILLTKDKGRYSRPEQPVEVYTRIRRERMRGRFVYVVTQEVDTTPVGEPSVYPLHLCPWMFPTWSLIPGEHYGRGMVEDYAGGFAKLSDLSEAMTLYGIEVMRVVHLVSAGSGTDIDDIANAETGEYVRGDPATVQALEAGDAAKLAQVAAEIQQVFTRLAKAFMYEANVRQAERVTAYELQRDAQEAENALGGVYSSLAESMQVPFAHLLLVEVNENSLPGLVTGELVLNIAAGIPALGRSSDVQNLIAASQEIAAVVPIAQLDERISTQRIVDMVFAGRSVDPKSVFKSPEELEQSQKANAQAQLGQSQLLEAASLSDQAEQLASLQ